MDKNVLKLNINRTPTMSNNSIAAYASEHVVGFHLYFCEVSDPPIQYSAMFTRWGVGKGKTKN